ncbi:CBS domain-containing protein [Halodesulfurarchaeum sp.]|uniref:CBS domain-containing protein n=1 Tax=Halodesulfurarchaeum sp. TaxID=1980530 RepID=UPI001BC550D8|nr:CBS domain-containing protein [Halodesulfurarchaeum sp.]
MDIADILSTDFVQLPPDATVSALAGKFEDPTLVGVVVYGDQYKGIVTRRQLTGSHHQPNETLRSLVWQVPHLDPEEDVRTVAQLMIDAHAQLLPVFEGESLIGVVTADDLLKRVQSYLDVATVEDAATTDLVTLDPTATFGDALHTFREQQIAHLPVVTGDQAVGIVSLSDVTDLTVRSVAKSQGGDPGGRKSVGGPMSASSGRAGRGGFGAREGDNTRLLDLPIRDVMTEPVRTISPEATLDTAVATMSEIDASSLIVTRDEDTNGILTKTDILDALTWDAGGNRPVQVYGTDLIDDLTYEDIVGMIENFDDRDHRMNVLDAKVHLQEHTERLRGTPLLLARIRLHTDSGLFIASGEGYGASHAINNARDTVERQIRKQKTYGQSKKPPDEEFWERRFGWLLEGD